MNFCPHTKKILGRWNRLPCFFTVAGVAACWFASFGCGAASSRSEVPSSSRATLTNSLSPVTVFDLAGKRVDPFGGGESIARVFIFISTDCPISNRYAPEIRRLHAKFTPQKVAFWLVHADPTESVAAIRKHAAEFQLPGGILRDPQHALVQRCRARVTPEAAVFTRDGRLAYHGRIDDRYVELGQARPAALAHDLEATLAAILAGKPTPTNETRAIGCFIPSLK